MLKSGWVHAFGANHTGKLDSRLREIACPEISHEWLWSLSLHKGKSFSAAEYTDAVKNNYIGFKTFMTKI